ncbi:GAF domain-containing protein [Bacillus sp. OVS6]|nr:GAF domain-containing protein [Bacillus sp. OVS6]
MIGVPIVRNQKVVGIVVLASNKKRSYDYSQLMIVDLLTAYLGVAIDNARSYEETKNKVNAVRSQVSLTIGTWRSCLNRSILNLAALS